MKDCAKNMRTLRANRIDRGQCTRCGKPLEKSEVNLYNQCEACRDYRKEYQKAYKETRKRQKEAGHEAFI